MEETALRLTKARDYKRQKISVAQNDTEDDQSTDEKTTSLDDFTSSESDASGGEDIRASRESVVTRKSARLRNSVNSR